MSKRKFFLVFGYLYILFQILYLLFDFYVLYYSPDKQFTLQFTTPYWVLWYLLVVIFYHLLIPLLESKQQSIRCIILVGSITVSLLAGYAAEIGYFLSLSRFFTFLPYFVLGYYAGHYPHERYQQLSEKWWMKLLAAVLVAGAVYIIWRNNNLVANMLYGSYSYTAIGYTGYSPKIRLLLLGVGVAWIFFLTTALPGIRQSIPVISTIGKNTLPIFLLHGFCMRYLGVTGCFNQPEVTIWWAFGLTTAMLLVFGNPFTAKLFHWLCTGAWLEWIFSKATALTTKRKSP